MPKAFRLTCVLVYPEKEKLACFNIECISLYKFCLYITEKLSHLVHSIYWRRKEILEARSSDISIAYLMQAPFCRVNARPEFGFKTNSNSKNKNNSGKHYMCL